MKHDKIERQIQPLPNIQACIHRWKNDCLVKPSNSRVEFLWHHNDNEDEFFFVVKGSFRMKFRDRERVVREGELIVVRTGRALPRCGRKVNVILIETKSTLTHGETTNERTVAHRAI